MQVWDITRKEPRQHTAGRKLNEGTPSRISSIQVLILILILVLMLILVLPTRPPTNKTNTRTRPHQQD